jgi:antitoxin (DNA-binding transcriptional repressor) of toxin-antitoxin stability system
VPDISATEAARNFADLLDAIEHRCEHYTIIRRGKAVAQLEPISHGRGSEVKAMLRKHRPDRRWQPDLAAVRGLLELDEHS